MYFLTAMYRRKGIFMYLTLSFDFPYRFFSFGFAFSFSYVHPFVFYFSGVDPLNIRLLLNFSYVLEFFRAFSITVLIVLCFKFFCFIYASNYIFVEVFGQHLSVLVSQTVMIQTFHLHQHR